MQWTPPSTIVCNESSFCVTKPICLFCCFSCCFFFQLKGGGTVGNALTLLQDWGSTPGSSPRSMQGTWISRIRGHRSLYGSRI
ncbi:unnamed protein product, partial [Sphagnum jensenii]